MNGKLLLVLFLFACMGTDVLCGLKKVAKLAGCMAICHKSIQGRIAGRVLLFGEERHFGRNSLLEQSISKHIASSDHTNPDLASPSLEKQLSEAKEAKPLKGRILSLDQEERIEARRVAVNRLGSGRRLFFKRFKRWAKRSWRKVKKRVRRVSRRFGRAIKKTWRRAKKFVRRVGRRIKRRVKRTWNRAKRFVRKVGRRIKRGIRKIKTAVKRLIKKAKVVFKKALKAVIRISKKVVSALKKAAGVLTKLVMKLLGIDMVCFNNCRRTPLRKIIGCLKRKVLSTIKKNWLSTLIKGFMGGPAYALKHIGFKLLRAMKQCFRFNKQHVPRQQIIEEDKVMTAQLRENAKNPHFHSKQAIRRTEREVRKAETKAAKQLEDKVAGGHKSNTISGGSGGKKIKFDWTAGVSSKGHNGGFNSAYFRFLNSMRGYLNQKLRGGSDYSSMVRETPQFKSYLHKIFTMWKNRKKI